MQELSEQTVEQMKQMAVESAALVNAEHAALLDDCQASQAKATSARDRALKIGAELNKVKGIGPGRFMAWVQVNCKFSHRTATKYMAFFDSNWNHGSNLPEDLSLRAAMVKLGIIPHRPREGGGTYRGGGVPSVYDPLNALTRFLGAVDKSGSAQAWESDEEERRAVQAQYKPKLEDLILRLFGVKVELPSVLG